jgi:hypothetical protein
MAFFRFFFLPAWASAYMLGYVGPAPAPKPSVLDESCYDKAWPEVANCVKWWTNGTLRIVEGNGVPDHDEHGHKHGVLGPYCPFGKDDPRGYCLPAEGGHCPFKGMVCPYQELAKNLSLDGDVVVPIQIYHEFPLYPDPTSDDLPNHLYHGAIEYQQVGVHLNGVHIKGPSEAEGYNVDTSMIPLLCGGHVTPPVGPGPQYHYHKASTCDHDETPGEHGPLIGYANDGFGIYGFHDLDGTAPVVDECNGHFGPVSNVALDMVVYHYHIHETSVLPSLTFDRQEPTFQPYLIGCQGPSKRKCNTTIAKAPAGMKDLGHNWCGVGCGSDICVQPGTSNASLASYFKSFGKGLEWLSSFTVNDYSVCPECYRQNTTKPRLEEQRVVADVRHWHQVCKICTHGICSKCRKCAETKSSPCTGCWSGGCLPSCSSCWNQTFV